ncbi:MAG: VWA domain-containing protein [Acidobacteria bacterium]|nr:VWA domain-containing protein [Acidobacteriota bacterium]
MRDLSKSLKAVRTVKDFRMAGHLAGAILVLFLTAFIGFAQSKETRQLPSNPPNQGDKQDTIKINVDLVVLHASVQDRNRLPVSGLGKEDFRVYEDGVLQQIESFKQEDIPVTVGLVIDNSGSMRPKGNEVIAAAMAFALASNANDQMFVVNFNENVFFGLPAGTAFTSDRTQLKFALFKFAAEGMTALYDAIAAGLEHLKNGDRDKKVLIVISDGGDNASRQNLARIMTLAKQSEAIIYTIGLFDTDDIDRNPGFSNSWQRLLGRFLMPKSINEAVPICERIARDIRSQYTLTYVPLNMNYDGKYRVVEVKAATQGGERLVVRTRAGYYVPLKP